MLHDKKHIHILYASRLVEEKGVDILISLVEKISQSPYAPYVSWTICGDGIYERKIVELAQKYSCVEYLGRVDRAELKKQYTRADYLFMPSRFLETFWLTALESLMCGTPVIGIRKGWLIPFIPEVLTIVESDPIISSYQILVGLIEWSISPEIIDVSEYRLDAWKDRTKNLFPDTKKLLIIHDYRELIGWAEYYIAFLQRLLPELGIDVWLVAYDGRTTPWKRRWMFIFSLFAFWRGMRVRRYLEDHRPDTIWMHSVLRYHGPWVLREVQKYVQKYPESKICLSHHDVGLIAAFPQSIILESQIPRDASLLSFLPREHSFLRIFIWGCKWFYIQMIRILLTQKIEHIIFAPFLERYIAAHFPWQRIHILPHTVENDIL